MENSLRRSILLAALCCLFLAGCIKDPGPCIPLPPKPSVLLPRYSTNNWTENGSFTFRIQRFTTPDANGRVGVIS